MSLTSKTIVSGDPDNVVLQDSSQRISSLNLFSNLKTFPFIFIPLTTIGSAHWSINNAIIE